MSFKDFITNRLFRNRAGSFFERMAKVAPPKNPSPRYVRKVVKKLLGRDARFAEKELEMMGAAAVPELVAVLEDTAYLDEEGYDRWHGLASMPLEVVLELLVPYEPQRVIATARRLLPGAGEELREMLAMQVGATGCVEAIPMLETFLVDEDEYVQSYAAMGIERAVDGGRAGGEFGAKAYDLLLPHCNGTNFNTADTAPKAVLKLDKARAARDLTSEKMLGPANEYLYRVLQALGEAGVEVPPTVLRGILDRELALCEGHAYPHDYVVAEALKLLAVQRYDGIEDLCRGLLTHPNSEIKEAAGEAIAIRAGVKRPAGYVIDRIREVGVDGLTPVQRVFYLGWEFDEEVCNGGLIQFFGNRSGDYAVETLDALKTLEIPEAVAALEAAMKLIGPLARERDRDMRLAAFEGRFEELRKAFEPLESGYGSKLRQKLWLYAAANAAAFKKPASHG